MYCIVFKKESMKKFFKKILEENFFQKIELYCIVFEKKSVKKIALYCIFYEKKIVENICQKNCIVLFSKNKSTQNLSKKMNCIVFFSKKIFVEKFALYCTVFERKIVKKICQKIVLYCFH